MSDAPAAQPLSAGTSTEAPKKKKPSKKDREAAVTFETAEQKSRALSALQPQADMLRELTGADRCVSVLSLACRALACGHQLFSSEPAVTANIAPPPVAAQPAPLPIVAQPSNEADLQIQINDLLQERESLEADFCALLDAYNNKNDSHDQRSFLNDALLQSLPEMQEQLSELGEQVDEHLGGESTSMNMEQWCEPQTQAGNMMANMIATAMEEDAPSHSGACADSCCAASRPNIFNLMTPRCGTVENQNQQDDDEDMNSICGDPIDDDPTYDDPIYGDDDPIDDDPDPTDDPHDDDFDPSDDETPDELDEAPSNAPQRGRPKKRPRPQRGWTPNPSGNNQWRNGGNPKRYETDEDNDSAEQRHYKVKKNIQIFNKLGQVCKQEGGGKIFNHLQTVFSTSSKIVRGGQTSGCDILRNLVDVCNDGQLRDEIEKAVKKDCRKGMSVRAALRLKLKTGLSYKGWEMKNQMESRTYIDPGKKALLEEYSCLEEEAADMMEIKDIIEMQTVDDVDGVVISLKKAQLALLADFEAKGLIDVKTLPKVIKWRLSLDGTVLKNGGSIVMVGIMPVNLNLSCQSSDAIAPVAFLRCSEKLDIIVPALEEIHAHIRRQQNDDHGFEFHGHREVVWMQSYDLASWWKMLQLAANANVGCCPFCAANHTNLHMIDPVVQHGREAFAGWKQAVLEDKPHPRANWLPIFMTQSCFCPLHAELRIWGDSFMDHLANIAQDNGVLKEWIEVVRGVLGSDAFNAEADSAGTLRTTALQGGQCKRIYKEWNKLEKIIKATGAQKRIRRREEDTTVSSAQKNKMCSCLQNGVRCRSNKMAGKSLCAGHEKQKLDGYTIKQCEADSCLTFQWVDCSLLDGLFKIAELLPRIFKAIQQNVPYYDMQQPVQR